MVKREFTFPSADGKTAIHAVEWLPEGAPPGREYGWYRGESRPVVILGSLRFFYCLFPEKTGEGEKDTLRNYFVERYRRESNYEQPKRAAQDL